MDSSYQVDVDTMLAAVRERDHLVFRFATTDERLFVDFRVGPEDGPAVSRLAPATTVKERIASIREVRPRLPRPERINIVAWPLRVGALERLGILAAIRERLGDLDGFDALPVLDRSVCELHHAEEDELRRAITGDGYQTLWPSPAPAAR